jgi:hypothetical protein
MTATGAPRVRGRGAMPTAGNVPVTRGIETSGEGCFTRTEARINTAEPITTHSVVKVVV